MGSNFVITDLNWLSEIIELISNEPKIADSGKNRDIEKIRKIVGKNVPLWKMKTLKQNIKSLISENKVNLYST